MPYLVGTVVFSGLMVVDCGGGTIVGEGGILQKHAYLQCVCVVCLHVHKQKSSSTKIGVKAVAITAMMLPSSVYSSRFPDCGARFALLFPHPSSGLEYMGPVQTSAITATAKG